MFLVLVLLEGVRSAEPPMVSLLSALMTSSAFSDSLRVEPSVLSATIFCFSATSPSASDGGNMSPMASSNSCSRPLAALRAVQSRCACSPCLPMARHWLAMSSGMTKAGHSQPSFLRAPATTSSPGASLCALRVPSMPGMPKPITVRQAIITGRSASCAALRARKTSSASWPLQLSVIQPAALKRSSMFSVRDRSVEPSIVMELSSHSTIRFLSL